MAKESGSRISALAVLVGIVIDQLATAMATTLVTSAATIYRYGPGVLRESGAAPLSPDGLLALSLLGIGSSALGGYAAGRFAGQREVAHGMLVGLGAVLLGAVAVLVVGQATPMWYRALSFLGVVPAATFGGYFARRSGNA